MIKLSRLNGTEVWINQDHIHFLERTPETVLSMSDGKKVTVKETPEEVIQRVVEFRRLLVLPVIGQSQV